MRELTIEELFPEGNNVDLMVQVSPESEKVFSATIYEIEPQKQRMVVSQTSPPILSSFRDLPVHITVLGRVDRGRRQRFGLRGHIRSLVKDYRLSRNNTAMAVELSFTPTVETFNLRTAFRVRTGFDLTVACTLKTARGDSFESGRDFTVYDISRGGFGMVVPKAKGTGKVTPLSSTAGDAASVTLTLTGQSQEAAREVTAEVKLVRVQQNYNENSGFIGVTFTRIDDKDREAIQYLVHRAELAEIRRMKGIESSGRGPR